MPGFSCVYYSFISTYRFHVWVKHYLYDDSHLLHLKQLNWRKFFEKICLLSNKLPYPSSSSEITCVATSVTHVVFRNISTFTGIKPLSYRKHYSDNKLSCVLVETDTNGNSYVIVLCLYMLRNFTQLILFFLYVYQFIVRNLRDFAHATLCP